MTVTLLTIEFWVAMILATVAGAVIHDAWWTVVRSDTAAKNHFARSNWRAMLTYAVITALVITSIVGWYLYLSR